MKPSGLALPRFGFDDYLVIGVVVALFFEGPDDSLWLKHDFPIPNLTFVLVGAVVLGRAGFLARRGRFDLGKPSWRELTVIGLFAVFAVTSVVAALAARPNAQSRGPVVLVSKASSHPYLVSPGNAGVRETRNAGSPGWTLRVKPETARTKAFAVGQGASVSRADPEMSYTFSANTHSSGAPPRLYLALRQLPGAAGEPVEVVQRFIVNSRGWTTLVLSTEGLARARIIRPVFYVPRSARPATIDISDVELVSTPGAYMVASDRTLPYAVSLRNARILRQNANVGSPGWTVRVKPDALKPALVGFPAEVPPAPLGNRSYTLTAVVSASSPMRLSVALRRWATGKQTKPVEKRVNVKVDSRGWTPLTLSIAGSSRADQIGAFLAVPSSAHPGVVRIARLQITREPKAAPLGLQSHVQQSVKTFAHFLYLALIMLVLGRLLTPSLLRRAFTTFFVLATGGALIACLQAVDQNALHTGATSAFHLISRTDGAGGFVRPCSIFSEPAVLGYYMLIAIIVGLWLYGASRNRWIWLGMGLCLVATLLAAAAGPIVTLVPVALYVLWRAARVWRRFWRELAVVAVAAVAMLVLIPAGATLVHRADAVFSGSDRSAQFRYTFDSASVKTWEIAPLTGVGLGDSRYYLPSFVHFDFETTVQTEFQSVNTYLNVLSESGVFGLLLLAVMLMALFVPLGRVRRKGAWVTEAPILLFIVSFFFINAFAFPIFWFWAGVRLAQVRQLEALAAGESAQEPVAGSQLTDDGTAGILATGA